jgi:two-component system response regulator AtoC
MNERRLTVDESIVILFLDWSPACNKFDPLATRISEREWEGAQSNTAMFIKTPLNDEEKVVASSGQNERLLSLCLSPAMQPIKTAIADVASTDIPVLIIGETGTGKEIVALTIHQLSRRSEAPFIKLRCSSLKPWDFDNMVSTGKAGGHSVSSSTVFLDEIGDISAECQSRLIESFSRMDEGSEKFQLGAGVISTTCRCMEELMRAGRFRRDLYYRLSGVCLWLPPLRQRREDIPPLAKFFLDKYSSLYGRPHPQISPMMAQRLCDHSWPGNVRELENAIKRVVALGNEALALKELGEWPAELHAPAADQPAYSLKQTARAASRQAERELILKVLSKTRWNRKRAAEELQISYKALLYKLKQIGLEEPAS